jgi:hypothetical protein
VNDDPVTPVSEAYGRDGNEGMNFSVGSNAETMTAQRKRWDGDGRLQGIKM